MILHKNDPNWANEFERLQGVYTATLGDLAHTIEHIGSTAVPQILAKPILDINIVIRSGTDFAAVKEKLGELGYWHNGNQGIPGREVFKRKNDTVPYTDPACFWMNHHLYVCIVGSQELTRQLIFRNYLRRSPDARVEYESIKKNIEARSSGDRKVYANIKENEGICRAFVERILKQAEPLNTSEP